MSSTRFVSFWRELGDYYRLTGGYAEILLKKRNDAGHCRKNRKSYDSVCHNSFCFFDLLNVSCGGNESHNAPDKHNQRHSNEDSDDDIKRVLDTGQNCIDF